MNINLSAKVKTLFGFVLFITLSFGLYPKDFGSHHKPAIDQDGHLGFTKYSLASAKLNFPSRPVSDTYLQNLNINIALTIPVVPNHGNHFTVLFSIHDSAGYNRMLLGQWKSTLVVMSGTDYRNQDKKPRLTASLKSVNGYVYPEAIRVVIEANPTATSLIINDQLIASNPDYIPVWTADEHTVSLGNIPSRKQGWTGSLSTFDLNASNCVSKAVELHNESCEDTYTLSLNKLLASASDTNQSPNKSDNNMTSAWTLHPAYSLHSAEWLSIKSLVNIRSTAFLNDVAINFLGFIPLALTTFAFTFSRYKHSTTILLSIVVTITVSVLIESLQIYIPSRTSSLVDLIVNSSASVLTVLSCSTILHIRRNKNEVSTPN